LRDRHERPHPAQHRAHRHDQHRDEAVAHTTPLTRVGYRGQHLQQRRHVWGGHGLAVGDQVSQLAQDRVIGEDATVGMTVLDVIWLA
jgi:hypothetical protein